MAQKSKWSPSAVLRAAVDVTRTVTSDLDHSEFRRLLKNFVSKKEYFLSPDSLEACKLLSHLGNNLRVRNNLEAAENICRIGLDRHPDHAGAVRIVMVTNLLLVLEDKGDDISAKELRDHLLPGLLTHEKLTFGGTITEGIVRTALLVPGRNSRQ